MDATLSIEQAYADAVAPVRADLAQAHASVWDRLGLPGTWWSGAERLAIARTVRAALQDPEPLPPWVEPSTDPGRLPPEPCLAPAAQDAVYRLARHAGTLSEDWYRKVLDGAAMTPEQWVETIEVTITVVAVDTFARLLGAPAPELPDERGGEPSRVQSPARPARYHWVPVIHVEDAHDDFAVYGPDPQMVPPVLRALSAVPAALETLRELGSAQYIPPPEMVDLDWTRGTLDRRQIELVASRLSALRECFY
ncbi:MAG: hypothetical protein GY929_10535 [Actinomycetia bacterium]|nr:hypothetical protein [Actinomycetes bacterium]